MRALLWPAGLLLTLLHAGAGVIPMPIFLVLDVAYLAAAVVAFRHAGRALPLLAAGVVVFALAPFTGIPTAEEPDAMLANAVLLLTAAILLLAGTGLLTAGLRSAPALLAVVALAVGTAGYLANLLARFAVVLAGAAPAQAAVEDQAWQAYAYLLGLPGEPATLTVLLVWLDLMQASYVVLSYVATGLLAVALAGAGRIGARAGGGVAVAAAGLTVATLVGATAAIVLDSTAGAWTVFVLTIPFMSTLLPHVLGLALLRRSGSAHEGRRQSAAAQTGPTAVGASRQAPVTGGFVQRRGIVAARRTTRQTAGQEW